MIEKGEEGIAYILMAHELQSVTLFCIFQLLLFKNK